MRLRNLFLSVLLLLFLCNNAVTQEILWGKEGVAKGGFAQIDWSSSSDYIVTRSFYSEAQQVSFWDGTNGEKGITLPGEYNRYFLHPSEDMVLLQPYTSYDEGLQLVEIPSGKLISTFPYAYTVAFSDDGRNLVSIDTWMEQAFSWDVGSGVKNDSIPWMAEGSVSGIYPLKENRFLILTDNGDKGTSLYLLDWHARSSREIAGFKMKEAGVFFSGDGSQVVVMTTSDPGNTDRREQFHIFETSTWSETFTWDHKGKTEYVVQNSDGSLIITIDRLGYVLKHRRNDLSKFIEYEADKWYNVNAILHIPGDNYFFAVADYRIFLYHPDYGNMGNGITPADFFRLYGAGLNNKNEIIVGLTRSNEKTDFLCLNVDPGSMMSEEPVIRDISDGSVLQVGHSSPITDLVFHPIKNWLFSGDKRGNLVTWDLTTGKELYRTLTSQSNDIYGDDDMDVNMDINPEDGLIAIANSNRTGIRIFDPVKQEIIYNIPTKNIPYELSFSANGRFLVYKNSSNELMILKWTPDGPEVYMNMEAPNGIWRIVPMKGSQIALGGSSSISIIDIETGNVLNSCDIESSGMLSLAVHPILPLIFSVDIDSYGVIWNYETGTVQSYYKAKYPSGFGLNRKGDLEACLTIDYSRFTNSTASFIASGNWDTTINGSPRYILTEWDLDDPENISFYRSSSHSAIITALETNQDKSLSATGNDEGSIVVWDNDLRREVRPLRGYVEEIEDYTLSDDGSLLAISSRYETDGWGTQYPVRIFDLHSGKVINRLNGLESGNEAMTFSSDKRRIASGFLYDTRVYDLQEDRLVSSFEDPDYSMVRWISWKNNRYFMLNTIGERDKDRLYKVEIKSYDLLTGKELSLFRTKISVEVNYANLTRRIISPNEKYIVFETADDRLSVYRLLDGKLVSQINESFYSFLVSNDNIFIFNEEEVVKIDLTSGRKLYTWSLDAKIPYSIHQRIAASQDENFLVFPVMAGGLRKDNQVLFDIILLNTSGNVMDTLATGLRILPESIRFMPNGQVVFQYENYLEFWDTEKGSLLATFLPMNGTGLVIFTPGGYYMSPDKTVNGIAFREKGHIYPFETRDLQYNRPDVVLNALGWPDQDIITAYESAYRKRLSKLGIDEAVFTGEISRPVVSILSEKALFTTDLELKLDILITDTASGLRKIQVEINGVPLWGSAGFDLDGGKRSLHQSLKIPLAPGSNNINITAFNEHNISSLPASFEISYLAPADEKPDLYMGIMSVSDYIDDDHDLKYARKDGEDLLELFQSNASRFGAVHTFALTDEEVTLENLGRLQAFFRSTEVHDYAVLFISGHGLLDPSYEFYYASYDCDFTDPARRGISYDLIEGLLDSIPARQKLLLMDACHSGEVDKESLVNIDQDTGERIDSDSASLTAVSFKGSRVVTSSSNLGLANSFQLMQELFTNLSNGSGTVVISAAAGDSYALEGEAWQNGVFTYSIKQAFAFDPDNQMEGDINQDGQLTVSELQQFVSRKVRQLTSGAQQPTSRQMNLEMDFPLWIKEAEF